MTRPKATRDLAARRARALADGTRRALLGHMRSTPLDVRALASRTGLHENAVRQHVAVLRDAGLVIETVERNSGRVGRPRMLYRSTGNESFDVNPFERLAPLLVEVAGGGDPIDVGVAEGITLAGAADTGDDAADVVAHIGATHGFAVHVERQPAETRIELGACPFAAIAGPVVCALHRGIVEGAARATRSAVTRFDIADPALRPCELTLSPTTGRIR
jgi:predicted ArsR family transcriptional regulator